MANQRNMVFRLSACGLLFFLLFFVYSNGLSGRFFFDDFANIIEIPAIKIEQVSVDSLMDVWGSGISGPLGRPISMLSFAANYYFSGVDPYWFKLTNVVIHGVNGVLIYFLALLVLRASGDVRDKGNSEKRYWVAAALALAWSIHPIQLTSVLYVVQRMTSLSSMFVLLALILHIRARQSERFGWKEFFCFATGWGVFLPLALLSKETAILFVLYVAVYEAILHRKFSGRLDRFAIAYFVLLGIVGVGFVFNFRWFPGPGLQDLLQSYGERDFSLSERVLTEFRIIWAYVKMIVAPVLPDFGLYHDDYDISKSLIDPIETAFSTVGLIISLVLAWAFRLKNPLVSFGILWFLMGHSLESSIFPLELMHEHRNYIPLFGLLLLVVPVFTLGLKAQPAIKLLVLGGVLAFIFYFILITYLRADMYGDEFRRTQIEAQYRLGSVRTQYQAGAVLVDMYNRQREPVLGSMAQRHFERVNGLDSKYKLALIGMLQLDCLSDQSARPEVYEELKKRLAYEKWLVSDRLVMHGIADMTNAGTLCLDRTQVDGLFAVAEARTSDSARDRSVVLSDYALYLWLGQKDYAAARKVLERAVAGDKDHVLNRLNLVQLLRFLGERDQLLIELADLQSRDLDRRDRLIVQKIVTELAKEGVLEGGS